MAVELGTGGKPSVGCRQRGECVLPSPPLRTPSRPTHTELVGHLSTWMPGYSTRSCRSPVLRAGTGHFGPRVPVLIAGR
jgi:hypothetical protein